MLTGIRIEGYKSIASCDVRLGPLTFLLGLNGAGKSNFIDALQFCRDALRGPLDQAFASRASNLQTLSHWGAGREPGFGLRFDLTSPDIESAHYSFRIGAQSPRGFSVLREECVVRTRAGEGPAYFAVTSGVVRGHNFDDRPAPSDSRLYLVNASGAGPFRVIYDALVGMEFYNPDPGAMKVDLDTSGPADVLDPDARNIASIFDRISKENSGVKERIEDYLRVIVPGLRSVSAETFKMYKLLNFQQEIEGADPRAFTANSMSDGTLRALAILVALFQRSSRGSGPSLLTIEEPETGLHPAAAGVLFDALREGASLGQVIVTSHSPDLLDNPEIAGDSLLAVDASSGTTRIAPLDEGNRSVLRDRLYTAGELLRMDQLRPERTNGVASPAADLFETPYL